MCAYADESKRTNASHKLIKISAILKIFEVLGYCLFYTPAIIKEVKKSPSKDGTTNMRVGIFRGTFDPIHKGHIAFAKQAILSAKLDYVYFLPEKIPQHKKTVGAYKNRLSTISQAIAQYNNLRLLELPNMQGYIEPMLPEIRKILGDIRLVFLMGSDVAKTIHQWPDVDSLCSGNELVIGIRNGDEASEVQQVLDVLPVKPVQTMVLNAPLPDVTSSTIRKKLYRNNRLTE